MLVRRRMHSCIVIEDQFKQKKVVVVGGWNNVNHGDLKSTEIYDVATEKWTQGSELPVTVSRSSIVTSSPGSKYLAYLVGGIQGGTVSVKFPRVYGLLKELNRWDDVGHSKTPRNDHVAMKLPIDLS